MITREQAEGIAAEVLGHGAAQEPRWELVEFDSGWLIRVTSADPGFRGAATRVVERADGRVMRFPSSVGPQRIIHSYGQVVDRGRVEREGAEPR